MTRIFIPTENQNTINLALDTSRNEEQPTDFFSLSQDVGD